MGIGEKIQQLRKAGGLSQEQLAEMLGVSRQAVSKWETDQSAPEIDKVLALSQCFGVSTDELLGHRAADGAVAAAQLPELAAANMRKRLFTLGWITAVGGLVLLILAFLSLRVIQFHAMQLEVQYAAGTGFYSDPMAYAGLAPMPAIFGVIAAIIALGIGLVIASALRR